MSHGKLAHVKNSMTGEMVPIKLHIISKMVSAKVARRNFISYSDKWNHTDPGGAKTYLSLLDKWDKAAREFSRYANIWYIARHGLSLN